MTQLTMQQNGLGNTFDISCKKSHVNVEEEKEMNDGGRKSWADEAKDKDKDKVIEDRCRMVDSGRFHALQNLDENQIQEVEDNEDEEEDGKCEDGNKEPDKVKTDYGKIY